MKFSGNGISCVVSNLTRAHSSREHLKYSQKVFHKAAKSSDSLRSKQIIDTHEKGIANADRMANTLRNVRFDTFWKEKERESEKNYYISCMKYTTRPEINTNVHRFKRQLRTMLPSEIRFKYLEFGSLA